MNLTLSLWVWMSTIYHVYMMQPPNGTNDGGWILPSGDTCTSATSPIRCTNVTTDGPTNITLQRVADFNKMELVYKCCLPNDCDNGPTDIIIANLYGKLSPDVTCRFIVCV